MDSILSKFVSSIQRFLPSVRAEEEAELVDPQVVLKEECGNSAHCAEFKEKYETCNARVNSRTKTAETCTEELFDFLHCVDHCVTPQLFAKLK